ncbi:kinase-like domain-containing protein [Mycena sp. CBHHK59/15]|nr:kinase-like domain-containing protein [Mycena sp. CBHHK59/15]
MLNLWLRANASGAGRKSRIAPPVFSYENAISVDSSRSLETILLDDTSVGASAADDKPGEILSFVPGAEAGAKCLSDEILVLPPISIEDYRMFPEWDLTSSPGSYSDGSCSSEPDIDDDCSSENENILPSVVYHNGAQYTFCFRLGEGATSHVMLALVQYPGEDGEHYVAVKILNKPGIVHSLNERESSSQKSTMLIPTAALINGETAILRQFLNAQTGTCSPFLTPLLASFQDDQNVYLVMRLYPETLGRRLRYLNEQGLKLSVDEIRLYAAELLVALHTLHTTHRTIHRDLKLENILIAPSGHLCLADFGLSQHFDGTKSMQFFRVQTKSGTQPYWPPELLKPGPVNVLGVPLDIWAFGLILFEMFESIGRPHFHRPEMDCQSRTVLNISSTVSDPDAADLIEKIMNREARKRPTFLSIQNHAFFATIDWEKVEARGYLPDYRPDPIPRPLDPNPSIGFSTNLLDSEDLKHLVPDITEFSQALEEVDYVCPRSVRFDPFH